MPNLLDEAIALVKALPDDDQRRAANALIAFAEHRSGDSFVDGLAD